MSAAPEVVVHPDRDVLAAATAGRLIARLSDVQAARGAAHLVVTGGTVGIMTLAAVAASPAVGAVDWGAVHVWWGDERFVPDGDPERNQQQARDALLDHVALRPETVHAMPASDGAFADVDAAAQACARELSRHAEPGSAIAAPYFDILMLGLGPDGHIASLFPGHPGRLVTDRTAIGVRDSPKPPPLRVSLTAPVIRHAREVWVIADGEGKADVVRRALAGDAELPASGAAGVERTLWLLDTGSASQL